MVRKTTVIDAINNGAHVSAGTPAGSDISPIDIAHIGELDLDIEELPTIGDRPDASAYEYYS